MYTEIKSVQILISLLKQNNIRHMVLSPGTRNTALVGSIENDSDFVCYSIVDERSAGFFALGIAEELNVPVCVSCTAATATANYAPAMKEAHERGLQLIALTADQDPYTMFHMEDQCIDQIDMFHDFAKIAVDVPKVNNDNDAWFCNRRMNEAFLEMNHHGKGPVQINYHMSYDLRTISSYPVAELPVTRKIDRIESLDAIGAFARTLREKHRILVVCGSMSPDEQLTASLRAFYNAYNCAVVYDTFSNQADEAYILPKALGDIANEQTIATLKPDLILICGSVFYSTIKYFIPRYCKDAETWQIAEDGLMNDGFRGLKNIFECTPADFFRIVTEGAASANDKIYDAQWKVLTNLVQIGKIPFTNLRAIQLFCDAIPAKSVLHTSVLDAIRMSNYVSMDTSVECYANIGADGIDGALSSFLGQANSHHSLSFLLIGDLSLMYDMNAIVGLKNQRIRIIVINNYAGAEFHKNFGIARIPTLNKHVAAGHKTRMAQCAQMANLKYLSATDEKELRDVLEKFVQETEESMLLEVFTKAEQDADTLKNYWSSNRVKLPRSLANKAKAAVGRVVRKVLH